LPLETNGILSSTELTNLFSNIKVLLKFHKEFLKTLKEQIVSDEANDVQCIGEVMLKMVRNLTLSPLPPLSINQSDLIPHRDLTSAPY